MQLLFIKIYSVSALFTPSYCANGMSFACRSGWEQPRQWKGMNFLTDCPHNLSLCLSKVWRDVIFAVIHGNAVNKSYLMMVLMRTVVIEGDRWHRDCIDVSTYRFQQIERPSFVPAFCNLVHACNFMQLADRPIALCTEHQLTEWPNMRLQSPVPASHDKVTRRRKWKL